MVLGFFREEPGALVLNLHLHGGDAFLVVDIEDCFIRHVDGASRGADTQSDHLSIAAFDLPCLVFKTFLERRGDGDWRAILDDFS